MNGYGATNVTFDQAAESYIKHGGEARYLPKIRTHLGDRLLIEIPPAAIREMAMELYPDAMPSTRNRQAVTPASAVMFHAHDMGWAPPLRIRKFKAPRSTKHSPVNAAWLTAFLAQSDADRLYHLSALVIFMNHTAARVSEAIELTGEWVDFRTRTATLVRTKTDRMAKRVLTDELIFRLHNLGLREGERVFRYTNRASVNERIRAVCRRAEIEFRPTRSVGRHSFATNAMNLGLGIKTAMEAGGWRSSKIFLETYTHSENAGRIVAERFNLQRYGGM